MAYIELNHAPKTEVDDGRSAVCILQCSAELPGGKILDVPAAHNYGEVIPAGTLLYRSRMAGQWTPAPLDASGTAYDPSAISTIVSGFANGSAMAILKHSVKKSRPEAAVMVAGVVSYDAMPFSGIPFNTVRTHAPGIVLDR